MHAERIFPLDPLELALRLTLLDLLLRPVGGPGLQPTILALAVLGQLVPRLLRQVWLWAALALATGVRLVLDWPFPDNHAYLLTYWCLAVALCLSRADAKPLLALNARLLVGLAFAFAALWKGVLSPDFLDGTFLRVSMLADPRLEGFARLVAGLSVDQSEPLRAWTLQHVDGTLAVGAPPPQPARFVGVAAFASVWTLLLEAAIALSFLWPRSSGPGAARHPLLILFCVTTYGVATVEGFGWLLVAMGSVLCMPRQRAFLVAYIATFLLILLYREVAFSLL